MTTEKPTLPHLITVEIRRALDMQTEARSPEEIVAAVTQAVCESEDVRSEANLNWALRSCVRSIYLGMRSSSRPRAAAIVNGRVTGIALPGWEELLRWRLSLDDGSELTAARASLAQIEVQARKYLKLGDENAVKGRHLAALATAMRVAGFTDEQTVEAFYQLQARRSA